jgi:hypothetical protein
VTRRSVILTMISCLVLILAGLSLLYRTGVISAGPVEHQIQLSDGTTHSGLLLPLRESSYLLQSADHCLILSADEITSVDGKPVSDPGIPTGGANPPIQETFEIIEPDGRVTFHHRMKTTNSSDQLRTHLQWGLAPHEFGDLGDYTVMDAFGNVLPYEVTDHSDRRKMVRVELVRPILPGETIEKIVIIGNFTSVTATDTGFLFRNMGDYPDNRLVTRTVQLPRGAAIQSISPQPLHVTELDGHPTVVWRRYFRKAEQIPWEIEYQLADQATPSQ